MSTITTKPSCTDTFYHLLSFNFSILTAELKYSSSYCWQEKSELLNTRVKKKKNPKKPNSDIEDTCSLNTRVFVLAIDQLKLSIFFHYQTVMCSSGL